LSCFATLFKPPNFRAVYSGGLSAKDILQTTRKEKLCSLLQTEHLHLAEGLR